MQTNKFGKNSIIYTLTTVLQKGIAFFLIPVYTVFIAPGEYGIISLILATIAILTVFFTLSFDAAIVRFYYDYKEDRPELSRKMSTLLYSMGANSILAFIFFMLAGPSIFNWLLPKVDFYPYIFLGLLILLFQPVYLLVLGFCQTTENAKAFSILSIGYFITHLLLTLLFVVAFGMGGVGLLSATLISAFIFSCIGLYFIKDLLVLRFEPKFIKPVLRYTLPLIPHSLAGHLTLTMDRFLLNGMLNSKVTGIYYLGFQLSYPVDVVSLSFNRAFVPTYFNLVEHSDEHYALRQNASLFFAVSLLSAFLLSVWGPVIFQYLIDEAFQESLRLLPVISFSFVATTIYYIHSCVLFYKRDKVSLVAVCTISANALNVILNILLIPTYGLFGAAASTLASQLLLAFAAVLIGRRYDAVTWPSLSYFILFIVIFILGFGANMLLSLNGLVPIIIKLLLTVGTIQLISMILWKQPGYLFLYAWKLIVLFARK